MARQLKRVQATFTRPSDATQYTAGDEIANSATAGSVVRMAFNTTGYRRVRVQRASLTYTIDNSTSVTITAADMDLLVFKTDDVPAAVGDNVAFNITGVQRAKAAKFSFVNNAWTNSLGAVTAGKSAYQSVLAAVPTVNGALLEFDGSETNTLTAVIQAIGAWNPGANANVFVCWLDLEVEP